MALDYDNIIDADGHILEPADAWERYIDPAYRDRALRIRTLEGREILEMNGKPSQFFDVRVLTGLGGMGKGTKEIERMMQQSYPRQRALWVNGPQRASSALGSRRHCQGHSISQLGSDLGVRD